MFVAPDSPVQLVMAVLFCVLYSAVSNFVAPYQDPVLLNMSRICNLQLMFVFIIQILTWFNTTKELSEGTDRLFNSLIGQ